jgi:APA family basic amino acid/polyamine antiporter
MSIPSIDSLVKNSIENGAGFRRSLSGLNLILLGIGGIIGAGIFVLTGQAAASYAGPAIVLSFIISGIGCAFAALCYAEFAAMIPVAGSAYTYAYATMGRFIAWIIGWDLILEYLFGASAVAVGWSGYIVSFLKDLGVQFPHALAHAPFNYDPHLGWSSSGAIINLPAMLIICLCGYLLIVGIKESAKFNNLIVLIKLTVIALFVAFGVSYINADNWTPFIPANTGNFGEFGWSGVFRGAGVIFFAYIGFDSLSTLSQEAKNPQRDMPIGILGSLAVVTVVYIAVSLVMTGIVPYTQLKDPAPIAVAINATGDGLAWLSPFIKLGAIAGLSSVVLVLVLAQPRIFYAMARDGLLPPSFAKIHPKYGTPHRTTMLTAILAATVAGLFPIGLLGELVSIGTLLAFIIVCIGVWVLRIKRPDIHRPFRCPLVPIVPILGALAAGSQMISLPLDTWYRLIAWMGIGLVLYFGYGRNKSTE